MTQAWFILFQLTASRRGWLLGTVRLMKHISFQLTASRRGWLFFLMKQLIWLTFQLTASRRGWPGLRFFCRTSWYFNSQPHEEADEVIRLKQITGLISTHSLTKRLTIIFAVCVLILIFQLTASRRGWRLIVVSPIASSSFQLTASRRGWQVLCLWNTWPP